MAIKWLDAKRLQGTNAERTALTIETSDCTGFTSSALANVADTGRIRASPVTASASFTVSKIRFYGTGSGGNIKFSIYSDDSDSPDALLATTGSKTFVDGVLTDYDLVTPTTYAVSSGTKYWLSIQQDFNVTLYTGSDGDHANAYVNSVTFGTTPDPFGGTINYSTSGQQLCMSTTTTYPNLPNGTIFNETDTYKYFMWNGTDTWNQMVSS